MSAPGAAVEAVGSALIRVWPLRPYAPPEQRGTQGFYMGPESGPTAERVFLREPRLVAVKQYRHVLVPPALVQKHVMRMHLSDMKQHPDCGPMCVSRENEEPRTSFAVHECDVHEQSQYLDEPFMEELKGLDLLNSVLAAPPDAPGVVLAVRGDNVPWDSGAHPMLGRGQHSLGDHLHNVYMPSEVLPPPLSLPAVQATPVSICRPRNKSTSEVAHDAFKTRV